MSSTEKKALCHIGPPSPSSDSYRDIGAFWDSHDVTETGGQEEVTFDVAIASQRRYLAVEGSLSERVRRAADRRGFSEQDLSNSGSRRSSNRIKTWAATLGPGSA